MMEVVLMKMIVTIEDKVVILRNRNRGGNMWEREYIVLMMKRIIIRLKNVGIVLV